MHIHFIGVGGTAMGSVAVACRMQGHRVTGSDGPLYPPMSDVLLQAGIEWHEGYSAERIRLLAPELVVVGNAISRGNPELEFVLDERWSMTSMAELAGRLFISRNTSIVCCGTHGKTTTASMAAWLLESAGREPGFLIGGVPGNFTIGCRPLREEHHDTRAGVFVSEGDEYDTAFFDKRSKFIHYRPTVAIINNLEFDHADIFESIDDIVRSFKHMVRLIPRSGVLLVNADDPYAVIAAEGAPCPVELVGTSDECTWRITEIREEGKTTSWSLIHNGEVYGRFSLPMPGEHNLRNATMAIASTAFAGLSAAEQMIGMPLFKAPKRRLEEIGVWRGCVVVDDFAHHPTAIAATIRALEQRYKASRIHVVFEPRSNTTTRNFFQHELASCFQGASTVCLGPINRPERYSEDERLDTDRLVKDIAQMGIAAFSLSPVRSSDPTWGNDIADILANRVQPNDVIAILSNGDVGGLRSLLTLNK
ncbi:MAG: Mur ligase family protein [Candidatus Kapabacteria bacterium]|nr:Mur ligase family protein [Candidatus Kapabacteria bacterium]